MMPGEILSYAPIDASAVEVLLCDADGNLFPSEGLAFEASTVVTNRLLHDLGVDRQFEVDELRRAAEGRNFRSTALALAAEHGVDLPPDELERRVQQEREEVTAHLGRELRPDPAVHEPLRALAGRYRLTVVSSSALGRLAASFTAAGLDELFPVADRFSAEDSLPVPTSKPDPAVYLFAGEALGVAGPQAVAIEDAVVGAQSAVAAGFPTVGNLQFVAPDERAARIDALREVGVAAIVESWAQLRELLSP
ncbi:HAD family hydrolase [Patulibacter americanus]|uniref:HAD family hydrolase n=1 Tax=Patulibacter americanus TaxID=588672 RepID=UPI003CCBDA77